jgi:hypothetical protein
MSEEGDGLFRFARRGSAHACAGSAGALIPPFEHHVLANTRPDRTSLTLHVYGGEMDHCSVFEPVDPAGDDLYRRVSKKLEYTE